MSRFCPYCHKEINHPSAHVKACARNNNDSNWKITYFGYNFPKIKDEKFLYECYVINHDSLPVLCKKVGGLDLKAMSWILNYYGIKIRSISESLKTKESRERTNNTNLKKYGAINTLSKNTPGYFKRNKTVKEKYGVDNVWQCVDIFNPHYDNKSKISSLNKRIFKLLEENHISYKREFKIDYIDDLGKKKYKFFDIQIGKILIEINGDYWHANPNKYSENTIFTFPKSICTAKDIWNADKFKINIAEKQGYKVICLWESFLKKVDDNELLQYIKNNIN